VPPVICKLDIDPSDTFPVPVKLTSPDALLTANPVNVPVPGTANAPVVLLNVNPELPFNAKSSLNCICVLLPPAAALSTPHDKLPNPSVFKLYPAVPPDICKFATAPKVTFADVVKLTIPVALLTVSPVNDPTEVIFGCALVVTVPAVVAAPDNAPTNVVAVIDALPKLALILVLITADEFPFADEVENVGYTVVDVDVFCNNADAFVALVALDTVPVTLAPTNELNPLALPVNTPVFAVNAGAVIVPLEFKLVKVPVLVIFGCALVVTVPAVVAAPDNAPTKVVAVIALFAKFIDIPELANSAIFPVVALAPIIYAVPVPGAVTLIKSATLA